MLFRFKNSKTHLHINRMQTYTTAHTHTHTQAHLQTKQAREKRLMHRFLVSLLFSMFSLFQWTGHVLDHFKRSASNIVWRIHIILVIFLSCYFTLFISRLFVYIYFWSRFHVLSAFHLRSGFASLLLRIRYVLLRSLAPHIPTAISIFIFFHFLSATKTHIESTEFTRFSLSNFQQQAN